MAHMLGVPSPFAVGQIHHLLRFFFRLFLEWSVWHWVRIFSAGPYAWVRFIGCHHKLRSVGSPCKHITAGSWGTLHVYQYPHNCHSSRIQFLFLQQKKTLCVFKDAFILWQIMPFSFPFILNSQLWGPTSWWLVQTVHRGTMSPINRRPHYAPILSNQNLFCGLPIVNNFFLSCCWKSESVFFLRGGGTGVSISSVTH